MKYTKRYFAPFKANPPPFKESAQEHSTQPRPLSPLETPETLPSRTAESQVKACAKGTGRWFKTALNRSGSKEREFNSQTESLLFTRLPPELRGLIWEFALSPTYLPYEAVPAHFHVYKDAVFDAYIAPLTCRAIHNEALRFLYKDQDFTVALCAGFARPRKIIKRRHSLGRPPDCATLFARMRSITLVVQPGEKPYLTSYTAHITAFLATLDNFQHTKTTTLHFNFGTHASNTSVRLPLIAAFHPLGDFSNSKPSLRRPAFNIHAKRIDPGTSFDDLDAYCDALSALCTALSPPNSSGPLCDLGSYTLNPPTGDKATDFPFPNPPADQNQPNHNLHIGPTCLRRGAWGEYDTYLIRHNIAGRGWQSNLPPPPPLWGPVLLFATLPVTVPVVLPLVVVPVVLWLWVEGVVRGVRKGEV